MKESIAKIVQGTNKTFRSVDCPLSLSAESIKALQGSPSDQIWTGLEGVGRAAKSRKASSHPSALLIIDVVLKMPRQLFDRLERRSGVLRE